MLNIFWTFVFVYAVAKPMIAKQNKVANLLNILVYLKTFTYINLTISKSLNRFLCWTILIIHLPNVLSMSFIVAVVVQIQLKWKPDFLCFIQPEKKTFVVNYVKVQNSVKQKRNSSGSLSSNRNPKELKKNCNGRF